MPIRSQSSTSGTMAAAGANGLTIPKPAGVQVGDVAVVYLRHQSQGGPGSARTFQGTAPALSAKEADAAVRMNYVWVKVVDAADVAAASWALSIGVSASGGRWVAVAQAWTGMDVIDPVMAVSGDYPLISGGSRTVNQWPTEAAEGTTLFFGGGEFASPNVVAPSTMPASFTETATRQHPAGADTTVSRTYIWLGASAPALNPQPAATITWPVVAGGWAGALALRAAHVAPPLPIGIPVKLRTGATAYLAYVDGAGERKAPARVSLLRSGFDSVAAMLAKPGFTWAHRGGSANYPEMSEYAYDQSVLRGHGVLEFSAQRSADGWWFGMHDPNFDAVAGVAGSPNASTLTRAQIEATYANIKNPIAGHASRPLYGLRDFLTKYGKTHVLVVDPKNAISFNAEFLALCDGIVDPARLIWKYYMGSPGSATPSIGAAAALARGWGGTWGYHYDADIDSGAFAEHASKPAWSMLGYPHASTQAYWDTALAVGKPVVAHIAPTQTAYASGMSKGAAGVQCSGAAAIAPISAWT